MKPHGHLLKKLIIFCFFLGSITGFAKAVEPSITKQGSKAFFIDPDDLLNKVKTAEQLEEILKKIDLPNSTKPIARVIYVTKEKFPLADGTMSVVTWGYDDAGNFIAKAEKESAVAGGIQGTGSCLITLRTNTSFTSFLDGLTNGTITRKFANILSIVEEAVLKFYTTKSGYKDLNRALRGEIPMNNFYLATNKVIKQLKQAGKFNGIQDLNKIHVLVKGKVSSRGFENMCRCPHCFQIIDGVNIIGNQ